MNLGVRVVADLSMLSAAAFWRFLERRSWCHPYDKNGERVSVASMPRAIADLTDDPYRSLAGALRRAGGYAKNLVPFSEFVWADFLRARIASQAVRDDFDGALGEAIKLASATDRAAPFRFGARSPFSAEVRRFSRV